MRPAASSIERASAPSLRSAAPQRVMSLSEKVEMSYMSAGEEGGAATPTYRRPAQEFASLLHELSQLWRVHLPARCSRSSLFKIPRTTKFSENLNRRSSHMPTIERTKLAACSACGNVKAVGPAGPSVAETCPSCKSIRAFRLIGWDGDIREFVLLPDRVS